MRTLLVLMLLGGPLWAQKKAADDSYAGPNPRKMILIGYVKGKNADGIGGQYISYDRNRMGFQWPSSLSVDFFDIKNNDKSGSLTTFSFSFKGLYIRPQSLLAYSLGIAIPLGQESVDEGAKTKTNFFVGGELRESVMFLPMGNGVVVEAGLFQKYIFNSELYPWDIGVRAGAGVQF